MKYAYNQNNLGFHLSDVIYEDTCKNCIFLRSEEGICQLINFGEDSFNELPRCWNAIFISEPLSHIFEL